MQKQTDVRKIAKLLASLSEDEIVDFLEGFLSPKELESLDNRLKIVKLLKQGYSQRQIAQKVGVGIATVTRGSNMIKEGHFDYV